MDPRRPCEGGSVKDAEVSEQQEPALPRQTLTRRSHAHRSASNVTRHRGRARRSCGPTVEGRRRCVLMPAASPGSWRRRAADSSGSPALVFQEPGSRVKGHICSKPGVYKNNNNKKDHGLATIRVICFMFNNCSKSKGCKY